jgi:DNA-binding transcriptional regulator GbsR (MarR family)
VNHQTIIEKMGNLFEEFGLNPVMGRVFGLLLSSNEAKSLKAIAKELEVSKAAVSIMIRQLESFGYCQKMPTKGNREHFYLLRENYLHFSYKKRISRELGQLDIIREIRENSENTPEFINERIGEFIAFNEYIIAEQMQALDRWRRMAR